MPAESCVISVFDKILTKFSKFESVISKKSFFEMELGSISATLENSTNRSLILVDEFGRGTHYLDGICLFSGLWQAFLGRMRESNK